jgi:probable F420-dependent oxidoreductase
MGEDAWLCPEQMVLLETDADKAREIARANMQVYVQLPNYQNNLRQFGFGDEDFADGGSDRLVDAIVAWGDEKAIADRIQAHYDAGANHVCIQPFRSDGEMGPDLRILEALAPIRH